MATSRAASNHSRESRGKAGNRKGDKGKGKGKAKRRGSAGTTPVQSSPSAPRVGFVDEKGSKHKGKGIGKGRRQEILLACRWFIVHATIRASLPSQRETHMELHVGLHMEVHMETNLG